MGWETLRSTENNCMAPTTRFCCRSQRPGESYTSNPHSQTDLLHSSKVTVKTFIMLQKRDKCCSFELSVHQRILKIKGITVFTKIWTVFNIDNNQKCFLSSKSAYYYDFWRSCDTEDWSNDAENTALITEINYILTDINFFGILHF